METNAARKLTAAIAIALAVAFVVLAPTSAHAETMSDAPFVIDQPTVSWPCGTPITVHIDETHRPDDYRQMPTLTDALNEWRHATGRPWPLVDGPGTVTIEWDPSMPPGLFTAERHWDATHYTGVIVRLNVKWAKHQYRDILHELGHVSGLGHTTYPGSLMGPNGDYHYGASDLVGLEVADWRCHRRQEVLATL